MECPCQQGPCICETATCSNQNCPKSVKSQNVDEDGNTHYVESIYQKIPLDDFKNAKKDNEEAPDSTLYSKIKEDDDLDCNQCCEHIYKPTIEQQRDCKIACNITAELYCQIRRQYAEPGEIISQCSNSSYLGSYDSSSDDERDDSDDNLGENSTEYVSAQARTDTIGSETSYGIDDDDVFQSTLAEDVPVLCDHPSCCSMTPGNVCKHKKLIRKTQSEEELVTITSDMSHTSGKKRSSGSRPKTRQKIEEANKQLADDEPAERKPHEPKRIEIASNVTLFGKSDEALETIPPSKLKKQKHSGQKEPKRGSEENVRRSKDGNQSSVPDLESDFSNFSLKYKNKKHVTIPGGQKEDPTEQKVEVNGRKRKYGSIHNEIFTDQRHSVISRESSYWPSRKRRITLKNFIAEEEFIKDEDDAAPKKPVKTTPSKPEHRDAYYVLEKSTAAENKSPWKTYVPCERSDFTLFDKEAGKKNKGGMNFDNKFKQLSDKQQPMVRKIAVPFRPKKILCFKYIPKITPVASNLQEPSFTSLTHLYVDPPEPLPSVISKAKLLGSKIPVSMIKEKPEQKEKPILKEKPIQREKPIVRVVDADERPSYARTRTLGDIPNVLEQRNTNFRRTLIPPELRKSLLPKSLMPRPSTAIKMSKKRATSDSSADDGSQTSLREKMRTYYRDDKNFSQESVLNNMWRKNRGSSGSTKPKVPKTCCSQTGIHVCIKESLLSRKGIEESNVIQMVNIDVTPKDSKMVKVNVMPTVPEINKEGVITIPVQLQLYNQSEAEAAKTLRNSAKEELLYQKTPDTGYEHYLKEFREEMEGPSPKQLRKDPPESHIKQEEIQTDLTLGKNLLSKSLNSITDKESTSTVQNKSAPVKPSWIDWETIVLPPPGTLVIKKVPMKKINQRRPSTREGEAPPSTSVGLLPPTEEYRRDTNRRNRFKLCCPLRRSRGESQRPNSKQSAKNKRSSNRKEPPSQDDPGNEPSNIISFVFSKSDIERQNQPQNGDPRGVTPCTSKPEIAWNNIIVPKNPHIKRVEKLDTSKTSTSITDQTETSIDEYFSKAHSTKTSDTCPNLSEDTFCTKTDKGTNTSIDGEGEDPYVPATRNRNVSANSMDILKAFKEDPVLSAFKAFEEELKPVRKALAEVQSKLRALNIPELECLFRKDPTSEYTLSHSSSQIGGEWRQPIYPYDNEYLRSSDIFDQYAGPSSDPRVYRLVLPTASTRSRNISTDMWRAFGSCDRNNIKGPYNKCWTSPHFYKMRTADSYNCPGAYYSRNSTPESDIEYVTFNSSGLCHGTIDQRFRVIHEDSYPPTYSNTPTTPPDHQFYGNSEHNIPHFVESFQPKVSASFHGPSSCKFSNRFIPLKVRPISPFFLPSDDGPILQNPRMSFIRPNPYTSKSRSIYAEPSEIHEYEALKYKQQQEYNFYRGYERYL